VGFPVPAWGVVAEADAARAAAVAPEEVRRHAAFIEKDIPTDIVKRLRVPPPPPISGDVGSALLVGVYGFF
jgi:hypothetical protein